MDCSKTINFLHELKRLCDSRDECVADTANKEQCPMFGVCRLTYSKICAEDVKTAIETVQKWSNEHPRKTYAQDFFEKFPEAKPDKEGVPRMCRVNCYGGSCQYSAVSGAGPAPCKACWNEKMEAADDE